MSNSHLGRSLGFCQEGPNVVSKEAADSLPTFRSLHFPELAPFPLLILLFILRCIPLSLILRSTSSSLLLF